MGWYLIFALIATGVMGAMAQSPVTFAGKVLDEQGNPVRGVKVAQFWLGGVETPPGFRPYGSVATNDQGAFELPVRQPRFPVTLYAIDFGGRRGAIAAPSDAVQATRSTLRLTPLRRIRYQFQQSGAIDLSHTRITLQVKSGAAFRQIVGRLNGTILLPPGTYALGIAVPGGGQTDVDFVVAEADLELDPIRLSGDIGQYYGRTPPSLETLQQVNGNSFALSTLRGKGCCCISGATGAPPASTKGCRN